MGEGPILWLHDLQFSDGLSLQIRMKLISEFFGDILSIFTPLGLFTYKKWKQMWTVFFWIPSILTDILEIIKYVHYTLYYDILITLELLMYLLSSDNFYYCLSKLSSIPGRNGRIRFYGWSRSLLFSKKMASVD